MHPASFLRFIHKMTIRKPSLLLINPWITDFAAYDFWSKPLGLLYLASVLRNAGAHIDFIDCLDRFDEKLQARAQSLPKSGRYGTGKYLRQVIAKPAAFAHVPRYYARYGLPLDLFRSKLHSCQPPDAILVTSGMTYWYPGVQTAIAEARSAFPKAPVFLGGIYATLMPEHAQRTSGADVVIAGEAESAVVPKLQEMAPEFELGKQSFACLDDYPAPAWDLYQNLPYGVVMSSRGCPLRCSFCASFNISGAYRWRQPDEVVNDIAQLYEQHAVRDIAFYDDALLTNHIRHLQPIMAKVREAALPVRFHTPNGLQCKHLNRELAREMRATGFTTMRLSLESVSASRQRDMSLKVNTDSFTRAVEAIREANFDIADTDAYVLMALPGQPLQEVLQTMAFVHTNAVGIRLAAYSPIPGTVDYQRAVDAGFDQFSHEPLRTNNSAIPLRAPGLTFDAYNRVALLAKTLNQQLVQTGHPLERTQQELFARLESQFTLTELHAVSKVSNQKDAAEIEKP